MAFEMDTPNPFTWNHAAAFLAKVERLDLHGLHFQHVALCTRRAWMYLHQINFAQWHERVAVGTVKHLNSYRRDHSTRGLFGLAPDRIDWQSRIVYENKGSGGAKDAADDQVAFYALMLSIASGHTWSAVAHILSSNRRRDVPLDARRLQRLWQSAERLEALAASDQAPAASRIPLCDTCSLAMFCGFD